MKNQKERGGTLIDLSNKPLIDELLNCTLACEYCFSQCLHESDIAMMVRCIELDRDCADVCSQAARLLARDAETSGRLIATCAELCRLCAQECRKHKMDHCQRCADACELCAEACEEYKVGAQVN